MARKFKGPVSGQMMMSEAASVTGVVAASPRLVRVREQDGGVGPALVVFPVEVYREDPEEQPVEYVDVVIEAGEVGGPQTTRSELAVHVLRDLDYGDQVSVHGTASEHVFQAGLGQEPMRTRRVQAESVVALNVVEFDRPRLVAMGTSPGETFSLQDKHARHAYTVEDPQAPLCPRGRFGQEGQVRPVTSPWEVEEAVWTTPMHQRPHALAQRGVEPREQPAPQVQVRATDAELEQAGVDREELTRGARRLSLELGAKFLPREADRRSAAEALEAMEPRHGARPARATWTPENPRATTAQRRVPKAAGSEIDRAAEGMARGQVPSPGVSGPEVSGPSR
ncbi:hypothetical protein [Micrococcus luteus]|uniref:hypothetical protein n=1 Tax=Micrococcus luteus TaxID=1270 RepID=UPI002551C49B|nr:hypothetical protein [Micrococcus luteus]MDK8178419.1 hypothetical protein [Micrococcus luteus]